MARRRDDDEEEDDRPRSRRRREEDEADDEPRTKRKPRPVEDDEDDDDRPRRRKEKAGGMSKGLLFGLIGGGAALVLVVVLLFVFLGGDGTVGGPPKAVVETYWKELKAGRTDQAFKYLTRKSRETFEAQARLMGKRGDEWFGAMVTMDAMDAISSGDPVVSQEQINANGTAANLELTIPGGRSPRRAYRLLKEEGKWKIDFHGGLGL